MTFEHKTAASQSSVRGHRNAPSRRSIPSLMTICLAASLLLLHGGIGLAQTAPKPKPLKPRPRAFLRVSGTQFFLGKFPYANVGVNIPDLFERFLNNQDASANKALTDAQAAGVNLVRFWGTTWGPDQFDLFEKDRARWFDAFDRTLAASDHAGIGVVPSLLFNIHMLPEYIRRTTNKDEQVVDYLTPGSASNSLAIAYVTAIVTRYKEDPRILFWEIGNEYNLEADLSAQWKKRPLNQIPTSFQIRAFLAQMAALIKRIDKKHPVTSGNSDMRPAAYHLREAMRPHASPTDPKDYPMDWTKDTLPQYIEMLQFFNPSPLDILCVHLYPPGDDTPLWLLPDDTYAATLPWVAYASQQIGKPLFIGEVGEKVYLNGAEQKGVWTTDFLGRVVKGQTSLIALWSWEFDPNNPTQSPYSLSPTRTPNLTRLIGATNAALRQYLLQQAESMGLIRLPAPEDPNKPPSKPKKVKPAQPGTKTVPAEKQASYGRKMPFLFPIIQIG